ncbi:dihydrofolate reductase family protein [Microbacterium saperdae]|uniref:Dihydrofolate reductase n=1 Tax=Microbacterium saperdae TaxID=69368 RepID=A0A543BHV0_9MICO|nr:dihydrofolate reductase family protein [Microbacterium saperdae]TQL81472.1 dihydrofolate reductase [Microbacterium saperdae]TQL84419.1 dihydrofolate reductase [Microbacterium saperdae]GGM60107.1 dihydrofolate reductase [Microbacterium saperdae]
MSTDASTSPASGRILIDLFTSLDGVAQGPGGTDEDTSGGFRFSGWQAGYPTEGVGSEIDKGMRQLDALLLGRRTYDIFAGYWPHHTDGPEGGIGQLFNRVPKYVASRDADIALDWEGSTRVGGDLAAEIAQMRASHREVHVIGSLDFVHTLLAEGLFDELNLWVYPLLLGAGKKVFDDNALPAVLRLLHPPITDEGGVTLLRYGRTDRTPEVGTF